MKTLHICTLDQLKQFYREYFVVPFSYCLAMLKREYGYLNSSEFEQCLQVAASVCCIGLHGYDRGKLRNPRISDFTPYLESVRKTFVKTMQEKHGFEMKSEKGKKYPYYFGMVGTKARALFSGKNLASDIVDKLKEFGDDVLETTGILANSETFMNGLTPTPFNKQAKERMENCSLNLLQWTAKEKTIVIHCKEKDLSESVSQLVICKNYLVAKDSKMIRALLPLRRELITLDNVVHPFEEYWCRKYDIHFIVY